MNTASAGIELWTAPNPEKPHVLAVTQRLRSLESTFGVKDRDINAGQEKCMVLEGSGCLLKRPGKRDVYFAIPVRHLRDVASKMIREDMDAPRYV